ncbi:SatD family protein [Microbacterium kyungheense]|uniref:SatD family protein n=1 Tax=Microbacterium kyungheense TaxID=1263636 RepID=A0A543FLZ9_9MICO|nr:SatD family protein [Microbacterium kyungheense]TQM34822.1 SatD family protein [Microbacterium kyungheense]
MPVAMTVDIVGSRRLPDRDAAQRALDDAIVRVERDLPVAERPLRPTVGDELQGVFTDLDAALATTLLVQLALPDIVQCRFGLGIGATRLVASASGDIPDGPAWWAARAAIDHVHALEQRTVPSARTWVVAHDEEADAAHEAARRADAYLLARDQLIGAMSERTRRLTYGRCFGVTQRELAAQEGITQSAVSQLLTASGAAAVVEGFRLLEP